MNKLRALVTVLLGLFMRVKSVLFSEMRNKLGDQIVGTGWKGRMVFRAYKTPANPNTVKQQAMRDHQKKGLGQWQAEMQGDADAKANWNTDALPRRISGYNLFMKLCRSSAVDCDATCAGPNDIEGTYTLQTDASSASLYALKPDGTTFEVVLAEGEMVVAENEPWAHTPDTNGDWYFWICDGRSKAIPPDDGNREALHNNWKPNLVNGVADSAKCVVSGY